MVHVELIPHEWRDQPVVVEPDRDDVGLHTRAVGVRGHKAGVFVAAAHTFISGERLHATMENPPRALLVDGDRPDETAAAVEAAGPVAVDAVGDAGDALERVGSGEYDCVVAVESSDVSALGLLQSVRAERPHLPVVVVEAFDAVRRALAEGATDVVQRTADAEFGPRLARRIQVAVAATGADATSERPNSIRQLMRAVPAAITRVDRDGEVVFANERAREVFGVGREEVVGRRFDDPEWEIRDLDGEPIPSEELPFRRVVDTGEPIEGYRHSVVWPDGSRRVLEISGAPVFDADGTVESVVFANRDVTERERRRTAFEALHRIATTIHRESTVEAVSERTVDAAADVLEFTTCSVLLREGEWLVPYAESEQVRSGGTRRMRVDQGLAGETIRTGESHVVEEITPDDETDPAKDDYRSGISVPIGEYGVFQAVSTEVAAFDEDDVEAAELLVSHAESRIESIERERNLERQNERLEEFAGIVSHDLRNPLNVASGHLDLARESGDDESLAAAADAIDRSQALIDDLLTLARTGQEIGEREPLSLAAVARESWGTVDTAAATLRVETDLTVRADDTRLRQLFENLFRNSVEHAGADVTVTVDELPDDAGFYVEDDGPGIPEAERETVFESGYSTAEEGNGFGLRIVDQVAEAHGWSVAAVEGTDGGARFEVTGVDVTD